MSGLLLIICGLVPGTIVISEFRATGIVRRLPKVILSVGIVPSGLLVLFTGLIIHTTTPALQELDSQMQNIGTAEMQKRNKKDDAQNR